jgi:hypothetical protein
MRTPGVLMVCVLALAPVAACSDSGDSGSTAASGGEEGIDPGEAGASGVGGNSEGAGGGDATGSGGGTVVPSAGLRLQFLTHDSAETVGQLSIQLRIMADEEVPLSEVTVRYWYTPDGATNQVLDVDSSSMGEANVTSTFGDDYVEIGFTGEGTIPAGGQQELQVRIHSAAYDSRYTLTNDWSYSPDADAYIDWDRITIYRNGQLVFGVEPT